MILQLFKSATEPTRNRKHLTQWSRKGYCPGCWAKFRTRHTQYCEYRRKLLKKYHLKVTTTES